MRKYYGKEIKKRAQASCGKAEHGKTEYCRTECSGAGGRGQNKGGE